MLRQAQARGIGRLRKSMARFHNHTLDGGACASCYTPQSGIAGSCEMRRPGHGHVCLTETRRRGKLARRRPGQNVSSPIITLPSNGTERRFRVMY
jgi:hypothetical protein